MPPPKFTEPIFLVNQMQPYPGQGIVPDSKRRRIPRACDMCRKKKVKCDGKTPTCTHCFNYGRECIYTHVEKKRSPPRGLKYTNALEKRLERMEKLLRLSGLVTEADLTSRDLVQLERKLKSAVKKNLRRQGSKSSDPEHSQAGSERESTPDSGDSDALTGDGESSDGETSEPEPEQQANKEVEALSDMMCSLLTNNAGETRYIGSSSGFSIFSPRGIQWVNEKTGDTSFQESISTAHEQEHRWVHWKPDVFGDIFRRRVFKPLPCKEEAVSLLKDYFANFNCMLPLFHEPTFMSLVDLQYTSRPYDGSGWWASLNVALAIAHRLRVMSNVVPQEEDEKGWGYLKNAMGVLTELTMRNTDLLSVQALLGMSLFLQGTPNPQPSFFLVAAAIRLAHSIGLHKRGSSFNLRPEEIEQRRRVYWIAYLVDKDLCLRSGRPPAQDDDDMNVELPNEDPPDSLGNIPLADGQGKINLFRLMCTFAVIENKVYKKLYSTKASKQSDAELLKTIGDLDRELEEWKDGIPIDFRPEHEIKASHTPLMLHVVVLHFAYYNCLTTIHRMSIHHGFWTSRLSDLALRGLNAKAINPRVFSSGVLCVQAARASIKLLDYIPQGDYACVWLILYFPVSALVTLFANVIQHPHDPSTEPDVGLMSRVVNFLSMLSNGDVGNGGVRRMLRVCSEFERIARVVRQRAEQELLARRKRKSDEVESRQQQQPRTATTNTTPPINFHPPPPASFAPAHRPITPRQSVDIGDPDLVALLSTPNSLPAGGMSSAWLPGYPTTDASSLLTPPSGQTPGLQENKPLTFASAIHLETLQQQQQSQQPFVPQPMWQMPMTLQWDWEDMTNFGPMMFGSGVPGGPCVPPH